MYVALHYAALKPEPKEKWLFVDKKSEAMTHRTEWCGEADRYRCWRCGRGSKYLKMPRKIHGTKLLIKRFGKMESASFGEVMTSSEEWTEKEGFSYGAAKCSGYARQRIESKASELL